MPPASSIEFGPGDTITVAYRIKEGNKERIQQYRGVVIRTSGEGNKKRFTVRKMSDNIGVERIFPIESPFIDSIVVNKYGKVRRAKLYYLRGLTGKKAPYQRASRSEVIAVDTVKRIKAPAAISTYGKRGFVVFSLIWRGRSLVGDIVIVVAALARRW